MFTVEILVLLGLWKADSLAHEIKRQGRETAAAISELHAMVESTSVVGEINSNLLRLRDRPVFLSIAMHEIDIIRKEIKDMVEGPFKKQVKLPPKALSEFFCHFLDDLRADDNYDTISILEFWSNRHVGKTADFYNSNKRAARQGARIRRVFILRDRPENLLEWERKCLRHQLTLTSEGDGRIETKYYISSELDSDLQDTYGNFGIIRRSSGERMVFIMKYQVMGSEWTFEHIEVDPTAEVITKYQRRFEDLFKDPSKSRDIIELKDALNEKAECEPAVFVQPQPAQEKNEITMLTTKRVDPDPKILIEPRE